jgi:hypothetical protein
LKPLGVLGVFVVQILQSSTRTVIAPHFVHKAAGVEKVAVMPHLPQRDSQSDLERIAFFGRGAGREEPDAARAKRCKISSSGVMSWRRFSRCSAVFRAFFSVAGTGAATFRSLRFSP